MDFNDFTKEELIAEIKKLQIEVDSLNMHCCIEDHTDRVIRYDCRCDGYFCKKHSDWYMCASCKDAYVCDDYNKQFFHNFVDGDIVCEHCYLADHPVVFCGECYSYIKLNKCDNCSYATCTFCDKKYGEQEHDCNKYYISTSEELSQETPNSDT